jgi:hypothetical protein
MMKKWGILFLAVMFLLTGCAGEASLVRDSIVASMEKPNYDYQGTLKLTGSPEKLLELFGEEENPEAKAILDALKAGVTITGSQLDLQRAKVVMQANDDKLLRDKGLWTGENKAAVELLVDNNVVYAKTPLDSKYLKLDTNAQTMAGMEEDAKIDPKRLQELQEKMNKLTPDFAKKYIAQFGYKLSQVKNHGSETVALPNGDSVKATHLSLSLDLKELVNIALYAANDAPANQEVKKFAVELLTLTRMLAGETDETGKPLTEAEYRAQSQAMVEIGMNSFKQWLDTEGKKYTADSIVEMAKQEGIEAVSWNFDFYVDENKMPVQQKGGLSITLKNKDDQSKAPVTVGLESNQYLWNFGKATKYELPKAEQTVTPEQLQEDQDALKAFHEKGFLNAFIKTILEEQEAELQQ